MANNLNRRVERLEAGAPTNTLPTRRGIVEEGETKESALKRQGMPLEYDGLTIFRVIV